MKHCKALVEGDSEMGYGVKMRVFGWGLGDVGGRVEKMRAIEAGPARKMRLEQAEWRGGER